MTKINVGIIGMGFIGKHHYDALRRLTGVHIRAIAVSSEKHVGEVTESFEADYVTADWREIIADPDIQVIHNCTPHVMHDEINLAAIAAGKHIYAEKPLSVTAESAARVCAAARDAGIAHAINHVYRMNAAVQEMHNRIASGSTGKLLYVGGCYIQDSVARRDDYNKRRIPNGVPARALLDIGVHWHDTAVFVTGMPIKKVYAKMYISYPTRIDPATGKEVVITSDDTTSVMVEFADGTPGSAVFSKVMLGHKNDLRVVVSGERNELRWEQERCEQLFVGNREIGNESVYMNSEFVSPATVPYISIPQGHNMGWPDAERNAVAAFYKSIRDGSYLKEKMPYATFEDGLRGNLFIEACMKSSKEDRWVEL